jgi:hypothetical protein
MSLYIKRLERGRFIWPAPKAVWCRSARRTAGYLLDGIDWRLPNTRGSRRRQVEGALLRKRRCGRLNRHGIELITSDRVVVFLRR